MAVEAKKEDERWSKMQESIDLMHAQVNSINQSQQQLAAQMELIAKVINQSTQGQLLLAKQLEATGDAVVGSPWTKVGHLKRSHLQIQEDSWPGTRDPVLPRIAPPLAARVLKLRDMERC